MCYLRFSEIEFCLRKKKFKRKKNVYSLVVHACLRKLKSVTRALMSVKTRSNCIVLAHVDYFVSLEDKSKLSWERELHFFTLISIHEKCRVWFTGCLDIYSCQFLIILYSTWKSHPRKRKPYLLNLYIVILTYDY